MSQIYRIPKFTDHDVIVALDKIRRETVDQHEFHLMVDLPIRGGIRLRGDAPEKDPQIQYALDLHSQVIPALRLRSSPNSQNVIVIYRKPTEIFDEVQLPTEWHGHLPPNFRENILPQLMVKLTAMVQRELRCDDLRSAMSGNEDTAWNRFRNLQTDVLSKLGQTSQILLVDTERRIAEIRAAELKQGDDLRAKLQAEHEAAQKRLADEYAAKEKALNEREEALKKQIARHETREAIYVAREEAKNQLTQLKAWLTDSSLTPQTVKKRLPVRVTYFAALLVTAVLTAYFSHQSIEILKSEGTGLAGIPWWQWAALTLKSVLPLVAFTTFAIYFIRWESAWAKQHSDEELRTRARVVDIGRSAWLLEAVRDAKDAGKDLPPGLLKDLSRNLFSHPSTPEGGELHPSTLSDMVMGQLSSLRMRTPDGAEYEARRGKT